MVFSAISSAPAYNTIPNSFCSTCQKYSQEYVFDAIAKLSSRVSAVRDLDSVFPPAALQCCTSTLESLQTWRNEIQSKVALNSTLSDIAFRTTDTLGPIDDAFPDASADRESLDSTEATAAPPASE
ncbi:hypothetical protein H0H87_012030, partial [Tephrocybe sp. NHM501043]